MPQDWGKGRIGIDTETRDETLTTLGPGVRRGGYVAGVSVAIEDGPDFYLPIRHAGGGNLEEQPALRYLRSMASKFSGTVCGANLGYDLDFLAEEGITFSNAQWFRDVQVADPLINELHHSYSMEAIASRWDMPGKDETLLMEALAAYGYKGSKAKGGIWALPARHVGPYAQQDARLPLAILRRQERVIEEQDLWEVYNLESRVLPVLVKMRRRGVAVSLDRLEQVDRWAREQQQLAIDAANDHLTGLRLSFHDITKTEVLGRVLKSLGVQLPKTAKGKDSVTAAVLEGLHHPIGDALRRAKKMSTLRTTFCDGVKHHLTQGRIHCTFNQLRRQKDDGSDETEGAAFGRLSSANPNLQNQPARDPEIGPLWRSIYIPDYGCEWASLDYSQQEPRQAVHSAIEAGPSVIGQAAYDSAMEAARRYREDPKMDFHDMMTRMVNGEDYEAKHGKDAFKQKRKYAKNIFLGLSYGMGGGKLCRDLGLPSAWRLSWTEGRKRRFKDFETREAVADAATRGREAGYRVSYWEVAGAEGQAIIDQFDAQVPFVRQMATHMQGLAAKQGYILTLSGRRCRFPMKDDGEYDWLHKAFNRRIQGGSADQTKMALVAMDEAGWPLQLQVHDEVDGSVESRKQAEEGAEIMCNVVKLHVPMKVDVEIGPSWGEAA
ncbi:DNA polymerase I [Pseudanabaena phage Pam3]|nr:DNA polymerase I [Pseudanabaena phage Pam3]